MPQDALEKRKSDRGGGTSEEGEGGSVLHLREGAVENVDRESVRPVGLQPFRWWGGGGPGWVSKTGSSFLGGQSGESREGPTRNDFEVRVPRNGVDAPEPAASPRFVNLYGKGEEEGSKRGVTDPYVCDMFRKSETAVGFSQRKKGLWVTGDSGLTNIG